MDGELDYSGIIEEAYEEFSRRFEEDFWDERITIEDSPSSNFLLYSMLDNIGDKMFYVLYKNS